MKTLLLFITIFYLTSCTDTASTNKIKSDSHFYQKTYYPTGQLKELISLNKDSVKDGLTTFYDTVGKIDSTENYLIGKLNGIKTFYGLDRKIEYHYENDTLYSLYLFDTLGNLKYQSPIDPNAIERPIIKLMSGRVYLIKDKPDTIVIITKGIPYYNRLIGFLGVSMTRLNDSSYIISCNKVTKDKKAIKVMISYIHDIEDKSEKPTLFDSVFIPTK